jgi:hypothetical protein
MQKKKLPINKPKKSQSITQEQLISELKSEIALLSDEINGLTERLMHVQKIVDLHADIYVRKGDYWYVDKRLKMQDQLISKLLDKLNLKADVDASDAIKITLKKKKWLRRS